MALLTGYQLKAARALAGQTQTTVAQRAGVNVNTIRKMEGRGPDILVSGLGTIRKVQAALEGAGIAFLDEGGQPGVRLETREAQASQAA